VVNVWLPCPCHVVAPAILQSFVPLCSPRGCCVVLAVSKCNTAKCSFSAVCPPWEAFDQLRCCVCFRVSLLACSAPWLSGVLNELKPGFLQIVFSRICRRVHDIYVDKLALRAFWVVQALPCSSRQLLKQWLFTLFQCTLFQLCTSNTCLSSNPLTVIIDTMENIKIIQLQCSSRWVSRMSPIPTERFLNKQSETRAQTNLREGKISSQRLPFFAQLLQFFDNFLFD